MAFINIIACALEILYFLGRKKTQNRFYLEFISYRLMESNKYKQWNKNLFGPGFVLLW